MKNEDFYSEPYNPKEFWTVDREFKPEFLVSDEGFELSLFLVPNQVPYQTRRIGEKIGAPWQNRTAIYGLQNRCTAIVLMGQNWWMRLDLNQQCQWRKIYNLLGLPIFLHIHTNLAPQTGIEPMTDRLTADCSTSELLRNKLGEKYGNRTRDNGITTRGFATKLISPYVNTFRGGVLRRRSTKLIVNVFTYGGMCGIRAHDLRIKSPLLYQLS